MKFRIGFGYDVHRFAAGRKMMLGGIEIPYSRGLDGLSDADALLHAICDSLLGAAGLRDIGYYFSDKYPKFKNIDSRILLKETYQLVHEKGFILGNLDCTVVAEEPLINPYIDAMKREIAAALDTEENNIGIKATTNEKLGSIGAGEGLAAYAVALIFSVS